MWNKKRKLFKYYISKLEYINTEKNTDYRCGPAELDNYERRERECTKEVYDMFDHEKKTKNHSYYPDKSETYTYAVCIGEEIVSPKETYENIEHLLTLPVERVKGDAKNDIQWGIRAIDVLVDELEQDIYFMRTQTDKYTQNYIATTISGYEREIRKYNQDKETLQMFLTSIEDRKKQRKDRKKAQEELFSSTMMNHELICSCGAKLHFAYNKAFCGTCGKKLGTIWEDAFKKINKENKKAAREAAKKELVS